MITEKIIVAKWATKCAETGLAIPKGEPMLFDFAAKKSYKGSHNTITNLPFSKRFAIAKQKEEEERENTAIAGYIEAQEQVMYDR